MSKFLRDSDTKDLFIKFTKSCLKIRVSIEEIDNYLEARGLDSDNIENTLMAETKYQTEEGEKSLSEEEKGKLDAEYGEYIEVEEGETKYCSYKEIAFITINEIKLKLVREVYDKGEDLSAIAENLSGLINNEGLIMPLNSFEFFHWYVFEKNRNDLLKSNDDILEFETPSIERRHLIEFSNKIYEKLPPINRSGSGVINLQNSSLNGYQVKTDPEKLKIIFDRSIYEGLIDSKWENFRAAFRPDLYPDGFTKRIVWCYTKNDGSPHKGVLRQLMEIICEHEARTFKSSTIDRLFQTPQGDDIGGSNFNPKSDCHPNGGRKYHPKITKLLNDLK